MTQTITINLAGKKREGAPRKSKVQVNLMGKKLIVTGIPDKDVIEYVARDAETKSRFYVVHSPKENWDYDSFRLHIGENNELIEAKVDHVVRYRDGGTTDIDYTLAGFSGKLIFPTPFAKDKKPLDHYRRSVAILERLV